MKHTLPCRPTALDDRGGKHRRKLSVGASYRRPVSELERDTGNDELRVMQSRDHVTV